MLTACKSSGVGACVRHLLACIMEARVPQQVKACKGGRTRGSTCSSDKEWRNKHCTCMGVKGCSQMQDNNVCRTMINKNMSMHVDLI